MKQSTISQRLAGSARSWMQGASLVALAAAVPLSGAQAQQVDPDATQSEEAASSTVDQIIVTAQFREQDLQNTPISITALSGDMLEARGMTNITQVAATAPNVNLRQGAASFGRTLQASIRGITQGDFKFTLQPSVAIYIDDVYQAATYGALFDLVDLERVEVLRGPQGTLFGRNAIGGAIRLVPQRPEGDGSGYVEGTYGSFNRVNLRGAVDVSLIPDQAYLRVSGAVRRAEGYMDVIDFACANPGQAGNLRSATTDSTCKVDDKGNEDVRALRAALRVLPADNVDVNIAVSYMRDTSTATPDKLLSITPNAALTNYNNSTLIPTFGIPYDNRFITASPFTTYANGLDPISGLNTPNEARTRLWTISGSIEWELTEDLLLTSITGYQNLVGAAGVDLDASPLPLKTSLVEVTNEQFSQELRLSGGAFNGLLDWTVGGYYFDQNSAELGYVNFGVSNTRFTQNDPFDAKNKSVFAHGVFNLSDSLTATLGVRYSHETRDITFTRPRYPTGVLVFPITSQSGSDSKVTQSASLQYQVADDVSVYGSYSTGFRSGGFNPRPLAVNQVTTFGPENLEAFELGVKSEWFDRRVRLNLAAFRNNYKDLQLSTTGLDPINPALPLIVLRNAGEARIQGLEAEFSSRPVDNLLIEANASYIDFKYLDLGAAAGVAGGPTLASRPSFTPKWKWNVGVQYDIELGDRGTLTPRFDATHQSQIFNDVSNLAELSVEGYTIANARLTWQDEESDWSTSLFVTNLFDKQYYSTRFLSQTTPRTVHGLPGRPREWGVTVRRSF